jgi:hypothetical protein
MKKIISTTIFTILALFGVALLLGLCGQFLSLRPTQDIPADLQKVEIDSSFPENHWIRTYEIYTPILPYPKLIRKQKNIYHLPLLFIPSSNFEPPIDFKSTNFTLTGMFQGTHESYKPFEITPHQIQSKKPYLILLDYINADFSSSTMNLKPTIINKD